MKTKIFVSAICPVQDEEESIPIIFNTFPKLISETELIFVEGGSKDNSWKGAKKLHGKKNKYGVLFRAIKQTGSGKGEAVKTGFNAASGTYLIIVDADLSLRPRDLRSILRLLIKDENDIIACGNRLKGIRKPKVFYWINYIGNYFFRYYYSLILQDTIKDISCGSKAMKKNTWKKIDSLRNVEGILDKWGDIDWLYYGKRIDAKIKYIPVSYYDRVRGKSKLQNMQTRLLFALSMLVIGIKILNKNIFKIKI